MTMSRPLPPSPQEGPPRATNFSRRNAMQPLPPSPAFTRILASSINMIGFPTTNRCYQRPKTKSLVPKARPCSAGTLAHAAPTTNKLVHFDGLDHHELAHLSLVQELDASRDLGEERVFFAAADVQPRLHT